MNRDGLSQAAHSVVTSAKSPTKKQSDMVKRGLNSEVRPESVCGLQAQVMTFVEGVTSCASCGCCVLEHVLDCLAGEEGKKNCCPGSEAVRPQPARSKNMYNARNTPRQVRCRHAQWPQTRPC